ncbi:MAG: glycosyltransferase [Armatimonadota bacterium]
MHIAMFSESYTPVTNGVAVSITTLKDQLEARGHRVTIVTTRHAKYRAKQGELRVPSFRLPYWPEYTLPMSTIYGKLDRFFEQEHVDIIHTHIPFILGWAAIRLSKMHHIPMVGHYHTLYDHYLHYAPFLPKKLMYKGLSTHICGFYGHCRQIITPSQFSKERLSAFGVNAEKINIIPTGYIDEPNLVPRDEARQLYQIEPQQRALLFVGRIAIEKNIGLLMDMMAIIKGKHPNAFLWIVGSGPAIHIVRRQARKAGVMDRVRFQGKVPHKQIGAVYSAADLFVFPSITETQGLVVGEAQGYSLPCIAADHAAAAESILNDVSGMIVDGSPEYFAAAVDELLCDEAKRNRLAEGALSAPRVSAAQMADMVTKVYEHAISR